MLTWFISLIIQYKYPLLFLIVIPEGPIITLLAGAFVKLGFLSFWIAYFTLMAGDLVSDTMWYFIGYYGGPKFVIRFGKYLGINMEKVRVVSKFFHTYQARILFISKITTGFGFALVTLITAGLVKIPFKKYVQYNVLGQFIWTAFLIGLGYTFEHLYVTIDNIMGRATIITVAVIIVGIIISVGVRIHKKIENIS